MLHKTIYSTWWWDFKWISLKSLGLSSSHGKRTILKLTPGYLLSLFCTATYSFMCMHCVCVIISLPIIYPSLFLCFFSKFGPSTVGLVWINLWQAFYPILTYYQWFSVGTFYGAAAFEHWCIYIHSISIYHILLLDTHFSSHTITLFSHAYVHFVLVPATLALSNTFLSVQKLIFKTFKAEMW